MTMGAFRILDSCVDGLSGLEVFPTLSATILIEWHRVSPFFPVSERREALIPVDGSGLDKLAFSRRS